jgi:hypothetical protein
MEAEVGFNVENPLHVDNIPVANLVLIEVEGQPIFEPKCSMVREACIKVKDYFILFGVVIAFLVLFGGVLVFTGLLFVPYIFVGANDD